MKKRLYIHIGNNKTGSTSIQNACIKNLELLKENDISLFHQDERGRVNTTGTSSPWIDFDIDEDLDNIRGGFITDIKLLASSLNSMPMDNVLMTGEWFSFIFDKNIIEEFYQELKQYFEEIKIIVYLRRQDEQIVSHHQESSKNRNSYTRVFYGNEPLAIPKKIDHHHYYMDYYTRVSSWGDIFGDENLIIKVFDRTTLKDKDVVADFFSILNLSKEYEAIPRFNESDGFQKTKVNHLITSNIDNVYIRRHLSKYLSNEGKMIPSKQRAINYYEYFKESNDKLKERYGIVFNENFDKYPEKDQDMWDEDSANEAIENLLRAMNDYNDVSIKIYFKTITRKIKRYFQSK